MSLVFSDQEDMVANAARILFERSAGTGAFRKLRDSGDQQRFSSALWEELMREGFGAPQIPERAGGLGMGYSALGIVAEETGRRMVSVPALSVAITAELLLAADDPEAGSLLTKLLEGRLLAAAALDEGTRHDPATVMTTAVQDGADWRLTGTKRFVIDGAAADQLIVSAKIDGALALFLVDVAGDLVERRQLTLIDNRNVADVTLHGASAQQLSIPDPAAALARALDVGRVVLAAELLGIAQEAFERTVSYLKVRVQFGRVIGGFQALQHRAARLFARLELARGVVFKALRALDAGAPDSSHLASLAKAIGTRVARETVNEAIQLHGGIGVTDECDLGFFYKRARAAGEALGDEHFHSLRLARERWGLLPN